MACGDFESEIGNALKAVLVGLAVGATACLIVDATKPAKKTAAERRAAAGVGTTTGTKKRD